MARGFAISKVSPANSLIASSSFTFKWEELKGAKEYVVELSGTDGSAKQSKVVSTPGLESSVFTILAGKRFTWSVRENVSVMPRSSSRVWFEVADSTQVRAVSEKIRAIESLFDGDASILLKAAAYYGDGYYHAAEQQLLSRTETADEREQVLPLLHRIYAKTGRLDLLPQTTE